MSTVLIIDDNETIRDGLALTIKKMGHEALVAPRRLVEGDSAGRVVWVAAADGTARRRSVTLGEAGTEDLVEVADGLWPTDRLIAGGRESLEDGDRVEITGEDSAG